MKQRFWLFCFFLFYLTSSVGLLSAQTLLPYQQLPLPSVQEVVLKGYLHHSEGYKEWLRTQQQKKINETPDSLALYLDLAHTYQSLKQPDSARQLMDRALKRFADTAQVWFEMSWMEFERGHYPSALETFFRGMAADSLDENQLQLMERIFEYAAIKFPIEDPGLPLKGIIDIDQLVQRRTLEEIPSFFLFLQADWKDARTPADKNQRLDQALVYFASLLWQRESQNRLLLEMFGDLLLAKGSGELAALAYTQAAHVADPDEYIQKAYRYMATEALLVAQKSKTPFSLNEIQVARDSLVRITKKKQEKVAKNEKFWIESGSNPFQEYQKKYILPQIIADSLPQPREPFVELVLDLKHRLPDYLLIDQNRKALLLQTGTSEQPINPVTPKNTNPWALSRTGKILIGVTIFNIFVILMIFKKYAHKNNHEDMV
ncbi:MAG: tetratricopeptide repeat protein [Bernardetiaceae bacterium]